MEARSQTAPQAHVIKEGLIEMLCIQSYQSPSTFASLSRVLARVLADEWSQFIYWTIHSMIANIGVKD